MIPGDQSNQAATPFGRIRLARIVGDWLESKPQNPRLIAELVAHAIRTLGPLDHPVQTLHVAAWAEGKRLSGVSFTHREVADYFAAVSEGDDPPILSGGQAYPATDVLVWREWINRVATEAISRADMAACMVIPASQDAVLVAASDVCLTATPSRQAMPSGSEPGFLDLRQGLLRQQGEKSASERLVGKDEELRQLSVSLAAAEARIKALEEERGQDREDAQEAMRDARDARRAAQKAEQALAEHAGFLAFMDENNPLSPPEGRQVVTAWADLTHDGTFDPVTEGGIGLGEIITRYADRNGLTLSTAALKRFTCVIAWLSRKNGGAVARPSKKKG